MSTSFEISFLSSIVYSSQLLLTIAQSTWRQLNSSCKMTDRQKILVHLRFNFMGREYYKHHMKTVIVLMSFDDLQA